MPQLTVRDTVHWCAAGKQHLSARRKLTKVPTASTLNRCPLLAVAAAPGEHAGGTEQQRRMQQPQLQQVHHLQLGVPGSTAGGAASSVLRNTGDQTSMGRHQTAASCISPDHMNSHNSSSSRGSHICDVDVAAGNPNTPVAWAGVLATAESAHAEQQQKCQDPPSGPQPQAQQQQQKQKHAAVQSNHVQQQRPGAQRRWERRWQQKQLKQHQQQVLQQRHHQLHQCNSWQQLLLLAADVSALHANTDWLIAVLHKAVELRQHAAAAPAAVGPGAVAAAAAAAAPVKPAATAALENAISTAVSMPYDQTRQFRQQQRFINNLLLALGSSMAAAAVITGKRLQAAASIAPTPTQLCQLLTSLSTSNITLPRTVQQQLAVYITSRTRYWQPLEAAAVAVGLARLRPNCLMGRDCCMPPQQQQQLLDKAAGLSGDDRLGLQAPVPSKQAAVLLWAVARLKWRPSQQWVLAAATAVVEQVQECGTAELSMALWGMGCLGLDMLLLRRALQQQQDSQPGSSSSGNKQSGALQQPGLQRPVALAPEKLLQAVFARVSLFDAQELLKVLWATAQIPLLPQSQLVAELLLHCQQPTVLQQYTAVDLAYVLWSLSKMQQQQDLDGLQQQQQQAATRKLRLSRQQQPQQQRGRAHLQLTNKPLITQQLLQPMLDALLLQLPASSVSNTCNMLHHLAVLGVKPPGRWLHRVLQHVQVHMSGMEPADTAGVISAVAELGFLPTPVWLAEYYALTQHLLGVHNSNSSSGSSGATGDPSTSTEESAADVYSIATSRDSSSSRKDATGTHVFTPTQLAVVAGAICKISKLSSRQFPGQKPPAAWLDALAVASYDVITSCNSPNNSGVVTAGSLSLWGTVVKRFSRLAGEPWSGPGRAWWECYIKASEHLMAAATAWDLANIMDAVAVLQKQYGPPPETWVQAAMCASRLMLEAAPAPPAAAAAPSLQLQNGCNPPSASDLLFIGKSFAQIGVLPDEQWRQHWVSAIESAGAGMTRSLHSTYLWTKREFASAETTAAETRQQQWQQQQKPKPHGRSTSSQRKPAQLEHQVQHKLRQADISSAAAAAPDVSSTAAAGSSMYTLVATTDSFLDEYEDEYEDDYGGDYEDEYDFDNPGYEFEVQSEDELLHDPRLAVADRRSIEAGEQLAQKLQQEWEQQQDIVDQLLSKQRMHLSHP